MQTTEAETVKADAADGHRVIGYWVGQDEAASVMGISQRTLRRWIVDRRVVSRKHQGRRQVRIDTDATDAGPATTGQGGHDQAARSWPDNVAGSVAGTLASVGAVEAQVQQLLRLYRADLGEQVQRAELITDRVRRSARRGWTLAAALAVLGAGGGVAGVLTHRAVADALRGSEALLTASQADRAVSVSEARQADQRADQLADRVASLGAVVGDQATEAASLRDQLTEAEREADRLRAAAADDGLGAGVLVQDGEGTR